MDNYDFMPCVCIKADQATWINFVTRKLLQIISCLSTITQWEFFDIPSSAPLENMFRFKLIVGFNFTMIVSQKVFILLRKYYFVKNHKKLVVKLRDNHVNFT